MRQTLFQISFAEPLAVWTTDPNTGWPNVGVFWLWLLFAVVFGVPGIWRTVRGGLQLPWFAVAIWMASGLMALFANRILPGRVQALYGYGFLVMLGFLTAVLTAQPRVARLGLDPDLTWDAGMWLLAGGVVGGRLFYLLQYHHLVYANCRTLEEYFWATINLSAGGLVLIGALLGGGLGFLAYCRRRKLSAADLADAFTPSIFIGIGFGRIGCLLNGCCFGDRCELPWAIKFPQGSVTFNILRDRGFVDPNAAFTMPLHPTQIYSSIDGFLIAFITSMLFAERRWRGEVFGWGCVIYSVTRFLMEFIRGDEMGQLGTGLTISQLYSLVIASLGIVILVWHSRRVTQPLPAAP